MNNVPFKNLELAALFDTYPEKIREKLLFLRQLIFDTAKYLDQVGDLEETLKWGEPAYLTGQTQSGSTIRIHWKESLGRSYGMYFICNTNLVSTFKNLYPDAFQYEGNRAILFHLNER